jgi:hypothetical protein
MHDDVFPGCIPSEDLVIAMMAVLRLVNATAFRSQGAVKQACFDLKMATLRKWLAIIDVKAQVSSNKDNNNI